MSLKIDKISNILNSNIISLALGFGAVYWVIESSIDAWVFRKGTVINQIFTQDLSQIVARLLFICVFIPLGLLVLKYLARYFASRQKKTRKAELPAEPAVKSSEYESSLIASLPDLKPLPYPETEGTDIPVSEQLPLDDIKKQ